MFTSYLFALLALSPIVIECYTLDLPIKANCQATNEACPPGSRCCSGTCHNGKCLPACQSVHSACNVTNICCPESKCHSSENRCCRSNGSAPTPSECCNPRLWKIDGISGTGHCGCVEHAKPCTHLSDCCSAIKCDYAPSDSSKKICI